MNAKGHGNAAPRDARAIDAAERTRKALALRRAGASYEQIAKELGLSNKSAAHKMVKRGIESIPREAAEDVRELELSRLDTMSRALWEKAAKGDGFAIERMLKIMKRRAEYLGLDAPKKQEHSGPEGGPIDISSAGDRVRSRLASLASRTGEGSAPPGDRTDGGGGAGA